MATTRVILRDASGADSGYLKSSQNWWFDPSFPHAFELFDLDGFYEEDYYASDHVAQDTVRAYVDAILHYGQRLSGKPVRSLAEFGCAGGWFTQEFLARGVDVQGVEGSSSGVKRALARGIPQSNILQRDLRRPLQLGRRFDIAVCTEVAEHIECPFSSQLVHTLVSHADIVWFSFEPPGTNEAHYHHSNEQPAKFWVNLFRFYDYEAIELPPELGEAVGARGTHVFCSPNVVIPDDLHTLQYVAGATHGLGQISTPARDAKFWVRKLVPPIVGDLARAVRAKARR